jgi:hypothetical protein
MSRRKALLITFELLAVVSFCAGVFVDIYFSQHSPTEPRPEEGKTHLVSSNKVRIYLTSQELIAFYLPNVSFFLWFAALAYFGVRWRLIPVATRQPEFKFPVAKKKNTNGD